MPWFPFLIKQISSMKPALVFCLSIIALRSFAGGPSNLVKINLPPLFLRTVSVQYERTFLRNFSGCVQVGQSRELSMNTLMNRYIGSAQSETLKKINSSITFDKLYTTGSTYFTPELRLYLSLKGAPKGFYLSGYYRIATTKVHADFSYRDSANSSSTVNMEGRLNGFFPGAMLGYQKQFLHFFTMDIWLAGVQWGSSKATFEATGDFHSINKEGVKEFIESNMKNGSASVTMNDQKITADYTGKSLGFRFGFCLGIAF
jgi:hypothetical protein